jgi:hypothetical protein
LLNERAGPAHESKVVCNALGAYRLWRDAGYVAGALLAGAAADAFGLSMAMKIVAVGTFLSGVVVAVRLSETRPIAMSIRAVA